MSLLPALYLKLEKWLNKIHGCAKKTFFALVTAYYQIKRPCISDLARELKLDMPFENVRQRLWHFLRHSKTDKELVYKELISEYIEKYGHEFHRKLLLVVMDWTDYGKFFALQLAIPFQGRAIPIYAAIVDSTMMQDAMTDMEQHAIKVLYSSIPEQLRKYVVILADRGFAKVELFQCIESFNGKFVIRLKRDQYIKLDGKFIHLSSVKLAHGERSTIKHIKLSKEHEYDINIAMQRLLSGEPNEAEDDTHYLATNLSDPAAAFGFYPNRMQIEEMFRDFKSFGLNLDQHQIKQEETMQTMMLVAILVYQFILQQGIEKVNKDSLRLITASRKGKSELSIFSQCMAILDRIFDLSLGSQLYRSFARHWVLKPRVA